MRERFNARRADAVLVRAEKMVMLALDVRELDDEQEGHFDGWLPPARWKKKNQEDAITIIIWRGRPPMVHTLQTIKQMTPTSRHLPKPKSG